MTGWERACAFAGALCLCFAALPVQDPAHADDMEKAITAVKAASDEDLRKEIDRRMHKSGSRPVAAASRGLASRGLPGGAESRLASLSDAELLTAAHATSRSIYGTDDRRDWYQVVAPGSLEPLARASVALFDAAKLDAPAGGTVRIKARTFQQAHRLCPAPPPVKFATQPSAAFCSGTLVRPDAVLTAGHCVREISGNEALPLTVAGIKFVFGYLLQRADADATAIPAGNVFTGREVLAGEKSEMLDANRHDWALVRLDRPVPASVAQPVADWETQRVTAGTPVFVMGFPAGLPLKYAPNATVRSAANDAWFVANLDTFGGNSGSGVYDQRSKKLVGILVEGELDYKEDPARGCNLINLCPDDGCSGETVSRISQVRTR